MLKIYMYMLYHSKMSIVQNDIVYHNLHDIIVKKSNIKQ